MTPPPLAGKRCKKTVAGTRVKFVVIAAYIQALKQGVHGIKSCDFYLIFFTLELSGANSKGRLQKVPCF